LFFPDAINKCTPVAIDAKPMMEGTVPRVSLSPGLGKKSTAADATVIIIKEVPTPVNIQAAVFCLLLFLR